MVAAPSSTTRTPATARDTWRRRLEHPPLVVLEPRNHLGEHRPVEPASFSAASADSFRARRTLGAGTRRRSLLGRPTEQSQGLLRRELVTGPARARRESLAEGAVERPMRSRRVSPHDRRSLRSDGTRARTASPQPRALHRRTLPQTVVRRPQLRRRARRTNRDRSSHGRRSPTPPTHPPTSTKSSARPTP